MSSHSQPIEPVPDATARVARAAFARGSAYMAVHDELGTLFCAGPPSLKVTYRNERAAASDFLARHPRRTWPQGGDPPGSGTTNQRDDRSIAPGLEHEGMGP
jgi:hypothetical protein